MGKGEQGKCGDSGVRHGMWACLPSWEMSVLWVIPGVTLKVFLSDLGYFFLPLLPHLDVLFS